MADFFISYCSDDSVLVELLSNKLKAMEINFFLDEKDIDLGKVIIKEVDENLFNCFAVIVIVSSASLKSQWVPYEIGYATALGKPIIPFVQNQGMVLPNYLTRLKQVFSLDHLEKYISEPRNVFELSSQNLEKRNFKLESMYLNWWEDANRNRNNSVTVPFNGLEFIVDRGVFSPEVKLTYSSYFSSSFLLDLEGKSVLDIGTGCGVLAIISIKRGASKVVAIDRDKAALRNANKNIEKFGYQKKIKLLNGDVFDVPGITLGKFDVIVANLPIAFKSNFWASSDTDYRGKVEEFFANLNKHLEDDGVAYLSWASFGEEHLMYKLGQKYNLSVNYHKDETFGVSWMMFEIYKRKIK